MQRYRNQDKGDKSMTIVLVYPPNKDVLQLTTSTVSLVQLR